jgi:hypothetical protein
VNGHESSVASLAGTCRVTTYAIIAPLATKPRHGLGLGLSRQTLVVPERWVIADNGLDGSGPQWPAGGPRVARRR